MSSKDLLLKCRTNDDKSWSAWVAGCVLAFFALCQFDFVSKFCVHCNVLKIALGSDGKVASA